MFFSWLRKGLRTGVLTTRYPAVYEQMDEDFRGQPVLDMNRCIAAEGCNACIQVCLPDALQLQESVAYKNDNQEQSTQLTLDYARCIMCGLCVTTCPADALQMTGDYELAVHAREDLKIITVFSSINDMHSTHGKGNSNGRTA
ncbi:MAG TPA: 4Fe-4S dicluster domain-containing protein [Ktedonobacteraceae bacterium]|nr:4Fe-4S dicluster domain-containing protein [Ktedonobacteraceae bacterium]